MANPFTAFAFPASVTCPPTPPASCNHSMPDRLTWRKNVKDWGAKGDGVTDDWQAIMTAWAAEYPNSHQPNLDLGTLYFPPGIYYISRPIDVSNPSLNTNILGCGPLSVITGNFPDFLIKRMSNTDASGGAGSHVIENLSLINTNTTVSGGVALGGGIRWGQNEGGAIRNCTVVANFGITLATSDQTDTQYSSFETAIDSCYVSPFTAGLAGSRGIASTADAPIANCRITGFEVGMLLWNGEGAGYVNGCYFEGNKVGIHPGLTGTNLSKSSSCFTVAGCYFKNNGTALQFGDPTSDFRVFGCYITGDESVTVFGSIPQYGINISSSQGKECLFGGVTVTGQYQVAAIATAGGQGSQDMSFYGVQATNTSSHGGVPWSITPITGQKMLGCNSQMIFTVGTLPQLTDTNPQVEGDAYNVSDNNGTTWAATAVGSGGTHAKVRWNGSNWTVMGI